MSRGQSQPKNQWARNAFKRCNSKSNNNTVVVDVDTGTIDVIIVDAPEPSDYRSRCPSNPNRKHSPSVISIDDEGDDIGFRNADHYARSRKTSHPSSSNMYSFVGCDSDECQVLTGKGKKGIESPKWMFDSISSESSTSTSNTCERDISESKILESEESESDSSDCEIMAGSSGNIREEWEKAASKKKIEKEDAGSKGVDAFGSHDRSGVSPCEPSEEVDTRSVNGDTDTLHKQNKGDVHSFASTSNNGTDDLSSVPNMVGGFTEEISLESEGKSSVGISFHTVGEGSQEGHNSKYSNRPLSETSSLHRSHFLPEVSFDHEAEANYCGQAIPVSRTFSCDRWMQHGLHDHVVVNNSMDIDDNETVSLFTAELEDARDEDMQRYENPSPCNIPCSSKHTPDPEGGKANDVTQNSSSFQPYDESTSLEPSNCLNEQHADKLCTHRSFGEDKRISQGSLGNLLKQDMNPEVNVQLNLENRDMVSDFQNDIISERERHKESEEYRRAEEEEWASRQRELQLQSEEAQKLRKKKKAENLRLLDMEKRQKQRVEEIRESQKRDEETINLKEQLRAEIRKELETLELKYRDMASLLRGLGISVGGDLYPMPHEVNAAYKQALLRFHPDRASRVDVRQQVEAEEKFKLISRLKGKLLPAA